LIVVDASVAVQWIAEEDTSELSRTILVRSDLIAPEFLLIEVANALYRKVFVGEISLEQALAGLDFIRDKVALRAVETSALRRAIELAMAMYHPIYDCIYLAVAEMESARLVTHDREFRQRGARQGLAILFADLPLAQS
jgi:predicted nucleic acid-binding protein